MVSRLITSGLACRASTKPWEKRRGVSLRRFVNDAMGQERAAYLEKTCCVSEGVVFEEPWPMLWCADG